jgi:hypothetical protein
MKKLALFSMVLFVMAAPAMAQDTSGSHEVKVEVTVVPNITVGGPTDYVNLGTVASGDNGKIYGKIPFRVHANTEAVNLQVCATNLYKGGDANAPYIPLCIGEDVEICTYGLATQKWAPDNKLAWTSEAFESHGLAGLCTVVGTFEAGTTGTFSIDFDVKVSWKNDNPELPVGNYFGYVKLIAEVNPNPVAPV